jgi:hypothetical protein
MSRLARWFIFSPLLLSLLVPVWLLLSDFLGYEVFFAPDPTSPRYDWAWLSAAFYIVWWPLFLLFVVPGAIMAHPLISFVPDRYFLCFAVGGLTAGVVYTLAFLTVYVLFRLIFRPRSRNA